MASDKKIIIAGGSHLAFHIYRKLKAKGLEPIRIASERDEKVGKDDRSVYDYYEDLFEKAGIEKAHTVFLAGADDRLNIEFFLIAASLNPQCHIIISLFNDNLAPSLKGAHPKTTIYNLGTLAAKEFADAIDSQKESSRQIQREKRVFKGFDILSNVLPLSCVLLFVCILVVAAVFFRSSEGLSWIDAFYFATTVLTTSSFGETSLRYSTPEAKIFGIVLMLAAVSLVSVMFSFIVDGLLRKKAELALGRRRYKYKGHVVVCGLGRIGLQIAIELMARGKKVLVIEADQDNRFIESVKRRGGSVLVSDATLNRSLRDANIGNAVALIGAIENDLMNLEIGLNARTYNPKINLVLRIFDEDIAQEVEKRLDIPHAFSASEVAARTFVEAV